MQKYRPMDKAGSYGVQEWIGYIGITGIKGRQVQFLQRIAVAEHLTEVLAVSGVEILQTLNRFQCIAMFKHL